MSTKSGSKNGGHIQMKGSPVISMATNNNIQIINSSNIKRCGNLKIVSKK